MLHELRNALSYDPETGHFTWIAPRKKVIVGTRAGRENKGRRSIKFNQLDYLEHRLAWLWMTGEWPSEIDHINCNPLDNRFCNLRIATKQQNQANARMKYTCQSGVKGVRQRKDCKRFEARIRLGGERVTLGWFDTKEAAAAAYASALRSHYGEFARVA